VNELVGLGRPEVVGGLELLGRWKMHRVARGRIERPVASKHHGRRDRVQHLVLNRSPASLIDGRTPQVRLGAVGQLLGVEDGVHPQISPEAAGVLRRHLVRLVRLRGPGASKQQRLEDRSPLRTGAPRLRAWAKVNQ
jgi:hypothetical protein